MINYDPHKWLDHFFDIRGSMVREILGRVALCVVWSAIVVAAYKYGVKLAIPSTIHTLVGLALGLLLVFRTNASYDRFWEGRKLWGGMVNESRNLVRAAAQFLRSDAALLQQLAAWTAAFPLRHHEPPPRQTGPRRRSRRSPSRPSESRHRSRTHSHGRRHAHERMPHRSPPPRPPHRLFANVHRPEHPVTRRLPRRLRAHPQNPAPLRLRSPSPPRASHLLLHAPFALVDTFGWTTVADTLLLSYVFFGIEEIGVEIEGPFGYDDNDLPLEQICDTIRHNVLALAGARLDDAEPPMPGAL